MRSIQLFLFILASLNVFAQTNTWIAQDGLWESSKNWSLGIVPTDDHDVVLPAGAEVTIEEDNWQAQSVDIDQQAVLYIRPDAYLWVRSWSQTGATFRNAGHLVVDGRLVVRHAYYTNNSSGIFNSGHIDITPGGSLELHHNHFGLENVGTVNISGNLQGNRHNWMISQHSGGSINISSTGYVYARRIYSRVINMNAGTSITNAGRIRLAYEIGGGGIYVYGQFENLAGADIWIQESDYSGIAVDGSNGRMINHGTIRLNENNSIISAFYVSTNSQMHNTHSGIVEINTPNLVGYALLVQLGAEFINDGEVDIDGSGSDYAVRIVGVNSLLLNKGYFAVDGDFYAGIGCRPGAQLINDTGTLAVYGIIWSLDIQGEMINESCGLLKTWSRVFFKDNSDVSNYGYWEHNSGQVDLEPASQLKNEAVIYDLGGAFDAIIANTSFGNDGVIINRQNYMPVAGQTYSNVFHLGGTSWGYIGSNWSISPNIIWSFATYDFGNNSLTFNNILPYQINQLYAEVGIDGCSSRTYRIPFAGAPNRPENPLSDPNTAHVDLTQPETTVFPNPIQSDFQLRFSSALEAPALIQLFDMSGRQLAQWAAAAEIGQMQLNRPANTPFGIYMLSILHANGEVEQQRLVFE